MSTALVPLTGPIETFEDETLDTVRTSLETLRRAAVDMTGDTRKLIVESTGFENPPSIYDRVRLRIGNGSSTPVRILEGAHEQIAAKLEIPWRYYTRMLESQPDLLAHNVNVWHEREPGKRLIRLLKPVTSSDLTTMRDLNVAYAARAYLSDRYKALDHGALFNQVLPVAQQFNLRVHEWKLTDKKFYLRFKANDETLREILGNMFEGVALRPGVDLDKIMQQIFAFGANLSNSETGHGAIVLEPKFEVKSCVNQIVVDYYGANGQVVKAKMRAIHVGGKLEESDEFYAADTKALDNAAIFLKVRDRLASFFTGTTKKRAAQVMLRGMASPIELPEEVGEFEFIDNVSQTFDLSEGEQAVLKEEILSDMRTSGQPLTPWAVSQGLTATARRIGADDFQRKTEIEQLGWQVLDDPIEKLVKAAQKSARNN